MYQTLNKLYNNFVDFQIFMFNIKEIIFMGRIGERKL
ncbi:hypothetical protein BHO_0900090 (plasmid) [Borrelia hermsii YBT]|uniref:Uncharacterized protein n=1 Tax=Borrelia hermsii YBT TaxID=1313295 RepID=W5T3K8_BORHE|nr:hypothetical protein BHO_0900090 [Borrelia hermsii YBT]